jgi:hypothetical protein
MVNGQNKSVHREGASEPGQRDAGLHVDHGLSMRRKAEMIGELGRKYILFGISAIRASEGIAEVDN